jgi:hypothetical protein
MEARSGYFDVPGLYAPWDTTWKDNDYVVMQHEHTKSRQQWTEATFGYFEVPGSAVSTL